MKICIYSSYAWIKIANNYGSILQYFALQTYLEKQGHQVYWLRFNPKNKITLKYRVANFLLKRKARNRTYKHQNPEGFQKFEDKYLHETSIEYTNYSQLKSNPPQADAYITGSDQVWAGLSSERYLTFAPKGSITLSYAASFGSPKQGILNKILFTWRLKKINYISVREKIGVEYCKTFGRDDAVCVCDPSLLLKKTDYEKFLNNTKSIRKPYIFSYWVNPIQNLENISWQKIKDYTKKSDLEIITTAIQGAEFSFNKEELISPTPLEWLQLIHDAQYVVTSSFHGVAFSIIMKIPFLVIPQKGNSSAENLRFYDLLNNLGLTNRIYDYNKPIDNQLEEAINWNEVDKHIDTLKKISFDFLKKALLKN